MSDKLRLEGNVLRTVPLQLALPNGPRRRFRLHMALRHRGLNKHLGEPHWRIATLPSLHVPGELFTTSATREYTFPECDKLHPTTVWQWRASLRNVDCGWTALRGGDPDDHERKRHCHSWQVLVLRAQLAPREGFVVHAVHSELSTEADGPHRISFIEQYATAANAGRPRPGALAIAAGLGRQDPSLQHASLLKLEVPTS